MDKPLGTELPELGYECVICGQLLMFSREQSAAEHGEGTLPPPIQEEWVDVCGSFCSNKAEGWKHLVRPQGS